MGNQYLFIHDTTTEVFAIKGYVYVINQKRRFL